MVWGWAKTIRRREIFSPSGGTQKITGSAHDLRGQINDADPVRSRQNIVFFMVKASPRGVEAPWRYLHDASLATGLQKQKDKKSSTEGSV